MTAAWKANDAKGFALINQLPSPPQMSPCCYSAQCQHIQWWLKGSKYLSVHSAHISTGLGAEGKGEKEGCGMWCFTTHWEEGERRECRLVSSYRWYTDLFFFLRWSQDLHPLVFPFHRVLSNSENRIVQFEGTYKDRVHLPDLFRANKKSVEEDIV